MKSALLLISATGGHRDEYVEVLARQIRAEPARVGSPLRFAFCSQPVLCATLDDDPMGFAAAALVRAVFRQPTVGLFLRPSECFNRRRLKHVIKYLLFRVISRLPNIFVVTILPFQIDRRFSAVASGWIYDPQLWDLAILGLPEPNAHEPLCRDIASAALGRKIIVTLGSQTRIKGFDFFVRLWNERADVRRTFLFVAAGRVARDHGSAAEAFQATGGHLVNRHLQRSELLQLYRCADLVWTCYAPDYDQASGIFGRAVQIGVPTIVRIGAHLEKLATHIGHSALSIPFGDAPRAATSLLQWMPPKTDPRHTAEAVESMRAKTVTCLRASLGV